MSSDNNSRELHRIGEHELHGPDYQLVCVWAEESGMSGEDVLRILLEEESVIENGRFRELRIDPETLPVTLLMPKIEGLVVEEMLAWGDFTALDLSSLPNLTALWCEDNQLTALDLSSAPNLTELYCSRNQLTALDLSPVPNLTELYCVDNQLTALDLSPVPNLTELYCDDNQLTALDLSAVPNLTKLCCSGNQLTALDLSAVPNLVKLHCEKNQLTALDLRPVPNLTWLECNENQLTELDIRPVREFEDLYYDKDKTRLIQTKSTTDKPVLTFSDDSLKEEVFGYADIPEKWWDGDYMSEVDHYAIFNAVYETASYVSEDEFDGPPGMSDNYYKVYADCESEFRTALSAMLLKLLEASPA